jgi:hypothetical protein
LKRLLLVLGGAYLLAAVGSRVAEQFGATACGCNDGCWCRRTGLSVFRWVFPRGHRSAYTAEQKAALGRDRT